MAWNKQYAEKSENEAKVIYNNDTISRSADRQFLVTA